MTPAQSRAARGLLDWSQDQLAGAARLDVDRLAAFEAGKAPLPPKELARVRRALQGAGVGLTDGAAPGVRLEGPASADHGLPPDQLNAQNDV